MKVCREVSLRKFDFWGGAKDRVKYLKGDELERIEQVLEELYPKGIDETELNDLFWFEEDSLAEWLGYENFEQIMERD